MISEGGVLSRPSKGIQKQMKRSRTHSAKKMNIGRADKGFETRQGG